MCSNHLKSMLRIAVICLTILGINRCLLAQANYFPLGIWNYDIRGPQYRVWYPNEMNLIRNIHATYLAEMSYHAQEAMIDSCTTSFVGTVRTELVHDTTGGYYPLPGEDYNPTFWRYISNNPNVADIDSAHVLQFVNNIASCYDYINDPGLGAIRVAHQGDMDESDHWPYIQYACSLICTESNFGGYVQSVAVHNVFCWDGGTPGLEAFFRNVDSLDVYQHEYYPFYDYTNPAGPPYSGDVFQNLIDDRYIGSCDSTRLALERSGNDHTTLQMIIQADRRYAGTAYFRRPNQAEIWLQAFLALGRGYKGIHVYCYRTVPPGGVWYPNPAWYDSGLVSTAVPRQPINIPSHNQPYNNVAQLYDHLSVLGPELLADTVMDAFTWTGTQHEYIQSIDGDTSEGSHRTIEVSLLDNLNNNYDYFMLINRRCNRYSSGVWVDAFPQHINVTITPPNGSGIYQIRDLYSDELYVTSDNTFRDIEILAGRGRVFELRRIFTQNETWTNTINICSDITVPSTRTLTISPNSTLRFHSGTELKLNGHLKAMGTSSQHITFTSVSSNPNKGSWDYIKIDNSSGNDTLIYCDIKYATFGVWGMTNSQIYLNHVSVDSSLYYGLYLLNNAKRTTVDSSYFTNSSRGIFLINSSPYLVNVNCTDNTEGIFCYNASSPEIGYSIISSNSSDGVACYNTSLPWIYHQTSFMRGNNWIRYNGGDGVYSDASSFPKMGFNSMYPGNNVIELNSGYEIHNAHTSRSLWAVYNWWENDTVPDSSDLHTPATIIYQPINPNSRPGSSMLAATPNLILNKGDILNSSLSDPEYYNDIGTKYLIEGKYRAAIEAFQYVIDEYPETPDAIYALVQMPYCYEGLNKKDDIVYPI